MSLAARIALSAVRRPALACAYGSAHPSQVADLHLPPGPGPHPVAVVLHGGHWAARYGKLITRPIAVDLARRGWAAWNVEYRRIGAGGGWPATFDDVRAAVERLEALGDARLDLRRVVAVGHSAGGQLALWAGAQVPAVRGVLALAAVCDLRRAGAAARALVGGSPDEVPERWAQASPLALAPLPVPVALVHPLDDATVPVAHSRALAARGGDVDLVTPPTGGHRAPIDPGSDVWRAAAEALARLEPRLSAARGRTPAAAPRTPRPAAHPPRAAGG